MKYRLVQDLLDIREGEWAGWETHEYRLACGHVQNRQVRKGRVPYRKVKCGVCVAEVVEKWGRVPV